MPAQFRKISYTGLLAEHLAELHARLRLGASGPAADPPAARPAHPDLPRLQVAACLLAAPATHGASHTAEWATLGRALGELASFLEACPGALPRFWDEPLAMVAGRLDELWERLDQGNDAAAVLNDRAWETVLAAVAAAGRPPDLDEKTQHGQAERHAAAPEHREIGPGRQSASVLLLSVSALWRGRLGRILGEAGYRVSVFGDLPAAEERLARDDAPEVVICDNLAPTHLMARLAAAEAVHPAAAVPALVLLSGAPAHSRRERQRALDLGARGAWCEPFRMSELESLLEGASGVG